MSFTEIPIFEDSREASLPIQWAPIVTTKLRKRVARRETISGGRRCNQLANRSAELVLKRICAVFKRGVRGRRSGRGGGGSY